MTERYEKSPAKRLGFLNGAKSIPTWWASQDLNPGPSGYEKVHCAEMLFFLCNNYKLHIVLLAVLHII